MTTVSSASAERARKYSSLVLQRLSSVGQNRVADEIGVSAPTVSRWTSEDLERACLILATVGLKIVPVEMQCFQPRKVQMLLELARDHLVQLESTEQLSWE